MTSKVDVTAGAPGMLIDMETTPAAGPAGGTSQQPPHYQSQSMKTNQVAPFNDASYYHGAPAGQPYYNQPGAPGSSYPPVNYAGAGPAAAQPNVIVLNQPVCTCNTVIVASRSSQPTIMSRIFEPFSTTVRKCSAEQTECAHI